MKVFLKHDKYELYAVMHIADGVNLLDITMNKKEATYLQNSGAWAPIINDLFAAGFDTRSWNMEYDFS